MATNLWEEVKDPKTGESSLQSHEVRVLNVGCRPDEHYFVFSGSSKREASCKKCKIVSWFVLGYHTIKEGKILPRVTV